MTAIQQVSQGVVGVGGLAVSDIGTATGSSGAATLNKMGGKVTTESLTTAAGATFTETITNDRIAAGDRVYASVTTAGTGTPVITKVTPGSGQVIVVIQNIHGSTAFNAALVISFDVIKAS